jgi:hypothetical protein
MDQNEMSNLYRGPSIDAAYQVSYHLLHSLSKQENNFFRFYFLCQKIATQVKDYKIGICCISAKHTNLKQEFLVAAMFVNGSKRNEQSL